MGFLWESASGSEEKDFFKLDKNILISGTNEIENMEQDNKLARLS